MHMNMKKPGLRPASLVLHPEVTQRGALGLWKLLT